MSKLEEHWIPNPNRITRDMVRVYRADEVDDLIASFQHEIALLRETINFIDDPDNPTICTTFELAELLRKEREGEQCK